MPASTPASVGNVKAFKGEVPSLLVQPYGSLRELEDVVVRAGSFTNAGAGWNTFTFSEAFNTPPTVCCQADEYSVEVKNITETSFLYRLVVAGSASISTTTQTIYGGTNSRIESYCNFSSSNKLLATLASDFDSGYSTFKFVTGVTFSDSSAQTTSDAIEVKYIAVEYGGE